ncbi:hypothetical protein OG271_03985 [Micromonospora rifamycinica]|uniref:hypothetical protein n=1 Tax=Micromonospora rifamycinica TaxID=291594 RepID=UPI002E2BFB15|nr:hypothetical protein [Micromonospora rifamycinica]
MGQLTDSTVVRHPETGEPVLLAAGGPVPDWATDLVGDHLLSEPRRKSAAPAESREQKRARLLAQLAELGDDDAPADPDPDRGGDGPPPRGGPGSDAEVWRAYADRKGVEVPADAKRPAIIAALDAAGVPTE